MTIESVHQVISRVKKERLQQKSRAREFLEAQHGWYASFMHQLLEKLADFGGAENIMFDWWTVDSESKPETDTDDEADKAKIQQILLMLCCKVKRGYIRRYKKLLSRHFFALEIFVATSMIFSQGFTRTSFHTDIICKVSTSFKFGIIFKIVISLAYGPSKWDAVE